MNAPAAFSEAATQATEADAMTSAASGDDSARGQHSSDCSPVIVIGGGPVGIRTAQELSRRGVDCIVFNAERWQPYNRVKLTPLLAGDAQLGQVMQPLAFPGPGKVALYSDQSVIDVDRAAHTIKVRRGRLFRYSKLVFCTGSRAHVPPIPGRELSGVFLFRSADDVERLVARSFRSRRAVVIGGGLLGLEAARGLANRGARTSVIEHNPYLMPRQLDEAAGERLAKAITAMGLDVRTRASVARICGNDRVDAIELAGGERIDCDSVVICTGIRANIEMARDIGLAVGTGIKVTGGMRTSDPDIYAAGECAEFDGNVYGLVGPGFEQALVAASDIAGVETAYTGSVPATKLKIVGTDIFSMGDVEQLAQRSDVRRVVYDSEERGIYRSIVLKRGRIVGAIAVGDWPEINRLQEAIRITSRIMPWQRMRFARSGLVWREREPASVHEWPRTATVCNCTGVTRGQVGDAIALGAATLDEVRRDTGASTVCGSCRIHVEALLGAPPAREAMSLWRPVLALSSLAALFAIVMMLAPRWPFADAIAHVGLAEKLWLDGFWKQVSGYTLLALSGAAAVLSLRKRFKALAFGGFGGWRIAHVAIGTATLAALFAHTGLRFGDNLNFWLMASFAALLLAGAAAGIASALEHRLLQSPADAARARNTAFWLHVVAFWPLPALLAIHILTVYYY